MAEVTVRALARSSSFAGVAQLVRALSGLVLTPLILVSLGLEGLGVWSLLFSLSNSIKVTGVSFGQAYAKFTAEYDARGDYDTLRELIGSGIALISVVSLVGLGVLLTARESLLAWTGVPAHLLPSAGTAFVIVASTVAVMLSLGCVRNILAGLQRTDLRFKTQITTSIVYFITAATLLGKGYGLVGLACANMLGEVAGIAVAWWWCKRLCPQLSISPLHATRDGMRRSLSLGGRFQVLFVLNYASNEGFKLVLSALLGPAMLGSYVLARRLMQLCQTAASAIHAPMMPAFANLDSSGQQERALQIHNQGAKAMYVAAMIAIGFVALFADEALRVWTSQAMPLSAWTFRALAAGFIFKQLSAMGTARLRARGRFSLEIFSMVFSLVIRLLLVIPLFAWYDYKGFVISETIAHIATALVFLTPYMRREGASLYDFLSAATLRPTLILVPVGAAIWWLSDAFVLPFGGLPERWESFARLAVWGLVYLSTCTVAAWLWLLSPRERTRISSSVGRRFSRG